MRFKWVRVFFAITLVLQLSSCATSDENKELSYQHYRMGVSLVKKNQLEKALDHLLMARNLDNSNELVHNHLGLVYYFQKEYEHAILSLKNAVSQKNGYSEAHNNLGRIYIDIKDFKNARKHLFIAANDLTYPHKDKVWVNIGLSYFFQNSYKKSQEYFLKALSANRYNCLAYNYYGRSLLELEKFSKAAKVFDQAIFHCKKKGLDEPHYFSGISHFRLGDKSTAIARLKEGQRLYPKGPNRKRIDEMINLMRITETK